MISFRAMVAFLVALALHATLSSSAANSVSDAGEHLAAVELAQSVSEITGTAISPLLGVSSVGAWRYYRTPATERARLPWFCQPVVWTAGFIILGLCFLKDLFGTAAPTLLKKPLDYLELFENKLSALVASSAFVPIIAAELARRSFVDASDANASSAGAITYASVVPWELSGFIAVALTVVLAVVAFAAVFLASHVINVLIALSPFTTLDAGLKLLKLGLLSVVTGGAFLSPWVSLAICLPIVLVAWMVAPWAFRFSLFGTVFAWDTVAARVLRRKQTADLSNPRCFTARGFRSLPVRTLGRVSEARSGDLVFRFKPWFVLPQRTLPLPGGEAAITRGVLCPAIGIVDGNRRAVDTLLLLPRYCGVAEEVANSLGIRDLRDGTLVGGIKGAGAWIAQMFSFRRSAGSPMAA